MNKITIRINREANYSEAEIGMECLIGDEIYEPSTYDVHDTYGKYRQLSMAIRVGDSALGTADPIHSGISNQFFSRMKQAYAVFELLKKNVTIEFNFGGNEVYVDKPYAINGSKMSLKEISNKLSRMAIDLVTLTNREHSVESLRKDMKKKIRNIMKTPEDILYCLENRVPYYFYHINEEGISSYEKVRLNLRQIGSSLYAMEISDGKWGEITERDLLTYLGHYLHGHKRGSWKLLSPKKLHSRIMKEEPIESELKVMVAFLLQNRTQDLVEKRAKKLIEDMAIQYKDRMLVIEGQLETHGRHEEQTESNKFKPMKILVKGQKTDWLLVESGSYHSHRENNPQRVHTYCLITEERITVNEDGERNIVKITGWNGPICINTGGKNPSLGDQFAGRALLLMNDSMASQRVSTIGDYLIDQTDRIRIPLEEKYTNEGDNYEYNEMHGMSIQ